MLNSCRQCCHQLMHRLVCHNDCFLPAMNALLRQMCMLPVCGSGDANDDGAVCIMIVCHTCPANVRCRSLQRLQLRLVFRQLAVMLQAAKRPIARLFSSEAAARSYQLTCADCQCLKCNHDAGVRLIWDKEQDDWAQYFHRFQAAVHKVPMPLIRFELASLPKITFWNDRILTVLCCRCW